MIKKLKNITAKVPDYVEVVISAIIIIAVLVGIMNLALQLWNVSFEDDLGMFFSEILGDALNLIIGLELIKMLTRHSAHLVIEVLIYVIARLLVVNHPEALNMLLGVTSIAILFAIRKYFFTEKDEEKAKKEDCKQEKQIII